MQVVAAARRGLAAWSCWSQHGRWPEAVLLALPLLYVTGVHLPLLCEARQSLPVKPIVLALATIGVVVASRASSLPLRTAGS